MGWDGSPVSRGGASRSSTDWPASRGPQEGGPAPLAALQGCCASSPWRCWASARLPLPPRALGWGSWAGVVAGRWPTLGPSVLPVNHELVRRVRGRGRLVVHSCMERDVGLLRLYPGIPAALVGPRAPGACPPLPQGPPGPGSAHNWAPRPSGPRGGAFCALSLHLSRDLHPLPRLPGRGFRAALAFETWARPRRRLRTLVPEADKVWPRDSALSLAALVALAFHPRPPVVTCLHPPVTWAQTLDGPLGRGTRVKGSLGIPGAECGVLAPGSGGGVTAPLPV